MDFKSLLIEKNIVNSDEILNINAKYHKLSNELDLNIKLLNTLNLDSYNKLIDETNNILNKITNKINTKIEYENFTLNKDEVVEYLEIIFTYFMKNNLKYNALDLSDAKIEGNVVKFKVPSDALGISELLDPISINLKESYGIELDCQLDLDYENNVKSQLDRIDKEIDMKLESYKKEAIEVSSFNKKQQEEKNKKKTYRPQSRTWIKDIPMSYEGLIEQRNELGQQVLLVEGKTFGLEVRRFPTGKSAGLALIKITDDTDSILVKIWLRTAAECDLYEESLTNNTIIRVIGEAEFDGYARTVIFMARSLEVIGKFKDEIDVEDTEEVKRVELHVHSKMTTLDGINEISDYYKVVKGWGHKAMALTDLYGVYALADFEHAVGDDDFKPIYGCELSYVDNLDPMNYSITFNERSIDLKDASYVVFDIETTGFSQENDEIIEIAAHKVVNGAVVDSFEKFINPLRHISEKITELTSITDDDVKNAKTIDEILPEFLEFSKDSILVAHNAKFDVGFIYAKCRKHNISYDEFPVIDTLNLFRVMHGGEVKQFTLKDLSSPCYR